ncbi:MAG: AzlD domain-containing protein [Gammaproteobacteria bacterium]|nr:AzlD domain-containing protein [Gammaproteobacteria bacterium]
MQELWLIVGMVIVTFGVRYPVMVLSSRIKFPPAIESALKFVPVAVLTAISVPILLKPDGVWWVSISNEYLVAGIVSIVIAAVSRNLLLTIGCGMVLFLVLRFFV